MISQRSEESIQGEKEDVEGVSAADLPPFHLQLDTGKTYTKFRQQWWQLWLPQDPPSPAPPSLEDAALTPLVNASIFSQLTYSWVTDIMVLGYQRTLQASDLYKLDISKESAVLAAKLEAAWQWRVRAAADWNARLESGELRPSLFKRIGWALSAVSGGKGTNWSERRAAFQKHWQESAGRKEASLTWSLNEVFLRMFWIGGAFKASTCVWTSQPLMFILPLQQIIVFAEERSAAIIAGEPVPNIGRGIAMAAGLFALTLTASICNHQYFWRSMSTGVLARAALITCIYERGVNLTGKARVKLTNAALLNHISTDVSRIHEAAQWVVTWTTPIQTIACLTILLIQLGPSALAGFLLFALMIPLQRWTMALQHRMRLGSMKWTDQRAKVFLEVLGAIRVVKYFSYEIPFLEKILELRKKELHGIRWILHANSANLALASSVPVLAATLAFVTYTLTAHDFNVAIIFSSLSVFQLLRQPMLLMPRALSVIPDASSAIQRLTHVFRAELLSRDTFVIDKDQEPALLVKDATFEWESSAKNSDGALGSKNRAPGDDSPPKGKDKGVKEDVAKVKPAPGKEAPLFKINNVTMTIQRGQLVAIVGPVGSGKSSLLQGLIGEMKKVSGHVSFGGRIGYCPQTAWIQNATLRDNITFGQRFEEDRYWRVVEVACLLPDLQMLPDGDLTEIGEKGINLSGGQKQRVNLARALYFDPEVAILDDPLSAVDAHVGKSLFHDAIVGALRNRGITVILVTHAIHFLSEADYIYTLKNGEIAERGTYEELISRGGDFARLDLEFGGHVSEQNDEGQAEEATLQTSITIEDVKLKSEQVREKVTGNGKLEGRLIAKERRSTGSVPWGVYWTYLVAGRASITGPLLLFFVVAMQGSLILNSYVLVWWQSNKFERPNSFYQTLYGCLGVAQAIFTFFLCIGMDIISHYVSQNLHHKSIFKVFHAPLSFFDTTPIGRILSIFGKDVDSIDNQLPYPVVYMLSSFMASIMIISVLEPYFVIVVFFIVLGYSYFAAFYRASAREVKRLGAMLRSLLYAHFSETLTGLPTIRSYGEMKRFIAANRYYVDLEDRALYLTITNQRWLAVRLDIMGSILVFIVALLAVMDISGINAAQIGLMLTYTTFLSQTCSQLTKLAADVENYMNSVERLVQYVASDTMPQEAPHEIEERKPLAQWPEHGAVEFNNVKMAYRPGLPSVLRGISFKVRGGEKIGVVGRTGAGKSSLMLALFRIVELSGGSITIDGVDISTIGLKDLRSKISIIPQDPLLFSGTMRSNLDPFSQHSDAELWGALQRSCLFDPSITSEQSSFIDGANRYSLDSTIDSEGANLSVGERSLLSLARALVKDSKVVVLDEATASVDLDTDNKIQHTIQTEFRDRTLLCIAHRLRTIISYDRILVLDAGLVVEFDTPSNLFKVEGGLFRRMCERSNILLKDIETSGGV
ncbi:ABC protein [Suillus bovinus]|uniref:ABC protein n=1 Tax=Suillus bovinus TaxID=48563 RepID=UPI001B86A245|nr:ABC protein [Suillus bovinus]KAG2142222.1 ABC protein [Suillus bovinus]